MCTSRSAGCGAGIATSSRRHGRTTPWWPAISSALNRQATRVRDALGEAAFARFAMGGGTPTYLDLAELESVLDVAERTMGAGLARIPGSVEVSPETVDAEKLGLLRARGIGRISIGVETLRRGRGDGRLAAPAAPQWSSGRWT